jgi:fructose-bisphosphate aldolase class II/tagatose 1,6-diphosphate aldolase GatY/KbaY
MTMKEKLAACTRDRKALLAVNFYNFETLKGLMLAAKVNNSSLILQLSEGTLEYLGIEPAVALARVMLKEFNVEGWIILIMAAALKLSPNVWMQV